MRQLPVRRNTRVSGVNEVILKRFEDPDEVRVLVKGRFEVVRIGGITIGRKPSCEEREPT